MKPFSFVYKLLLLAVLMGSGLASAADKVDINSADAAQLEQVYKRKPRAPYLEQRMQDGSTEKSKSAKPAPSCATRSPSTCGICTRDDHPTKATRKAAHPTSHKAEALALTTAQRPFATGAAHDRQRTDAASAGDDWAIEAR